MMNDITSIFPAIVFYQSFDHVKTNKTETMYFTQFVNHWKNNKSNSLTSVWIDC